MNGSPPITRTTFPTCRAHYPGGSSGCTCRLLPTLIRAFPKWQEGRHPHCHFRGLRRLHSRYGPPDRSATVGDARDVVEPGEIFLGLSYDELKDAAPGSFTVKDGMVVIDHVRPQER